MAEGGHSSWDISGTSEADLDISTSDYLTPANVEQALFQSTWLKYWDDTKKKTIKVSNKDGLHAEEHMLANVYKNAWIKLELEKHELQEEENKTHIRWSKELQHQSERERFYKENKQQLKLDKEGKLSLKNDKKQELTKKKEHWMKKCEKGERTIKEMERECQKLKKLQVERYSTKQENLVTVLGYLYLKKEHNKDKASKVVSGLQEYAGQLGVVSLPKEFWVSRSPCSDCSDILIQAYANLPKPTIHIGDIHKGNPKNIRMLQGESFKFKPWDLQVEYKNWVITQDRFSAQPQPGYLTPSNIQQVFSDELQVLKYRSNPEKTDKRSDIIKCTKVCPEEKMLERVTITAQESLKWEKLGQSEMEYLKIPSERKLKELQDRMDCIEELRQKEMEIIKLKISIEDAQKSLLDPTAKVVLDKIAKGLKPDVTAYPPRQEERARLQEEERNLQEKLFQLTSSKEQAASNIQMLPFYTQILPAEFWLSKSPCPKCAEQLIKAYEYQEKPTIHIALDSVAIELKKRGFKIRQWDLQQESESWQYDFEQSQNYQKYSEKIREVERLLARTVLRGRSEVGPSPPCESSESSDHDSNSYSD